MKSKSIVTGALLLACAFGTGIAYVNLDALETALATANVHAHKVQGAASPGRDGDHFGCHRHGAATYHCH